jgi:hypothetical protein
MLKNQQLLQNINLAYGYLWWLKWQTSFRLPQSQLNFQGSSTAPSDVHILRKNDQKNIRSSKQENGSTRMGDAADSGNLALSDFDAVLWQKISNLNLNPFDFTRRKHTEKKTSYT